MTIIEVAPLSNGAHLNQTGAHFETIPEGWAVIPEELLPVWEAAAPFVSVIAESGVVTELMPGRRQEPEPELKAEIQLTDYVGLYAAKVVAGEISITDVPERFRADVQYNVIQILRQGG